jgi:hypothetical protein
VREETQVLNPVILAHNEEVVLDPTYRAVKRMELVSHPLRQFQNSEYAEGYAVQHTRFDRCNYRWHSGLLKTDKNYLKSNLLNRHHFLGGTN